MVHRLLLVGGRQLLVDEGVGQLQVHDAGQFNVAAGPRDQADGKLAQGEDLTGVGQAGLLLRAEAVQHLQIACWDTRQPLYTVNFAIATMLKMVPSLRHLHLSRCSQNTCKALSIWAQYTQLQALPCLHSLTIFQTDLRNCSADLVALCRNLSTHLKNIWLLECQVVSDYQGTRILQDLRNSGIPNVFLEPRVT